MANLGTLLHLEGRTIGGCRLIRRLGVGGMGEVYLAEQERLGNRRVAVKIVRPDDEAGQDFRDAARHFLHEGRMLAGFAHPNVLPVHDSGVEDGCFYLVMEYAPDGSLKDTLSGRGSHPLPPPVEVGIAVEIVSQIAAALHYTHERGIVHGDVKPGNVLVEREPDGHRRMLLADYGVARELEATAQVSRVTGTVAYMAPEQFSGAFSPASDQYALAVVAYQLLAGHPPFEGGFAEQMRGHLDLAPAPLRGVNPAVPRSVDLVIRRALAKEPAERFPSVMAFADALELALHAETERTVFGAPGAWDETITVRPALASRRQHSSHGRAQHQPARALRTHQVPHSSGVVFFANESATERLPYVANVARHVNGRRLGVFATCAALLLVAMLVAVGTNTTRNTRGFAPNTQDIAAGGNRDTAPARGRPSTPTPVPSTTPNTIESDFAGDAFTVAGVSAPSSVAPGQPFVASITLTNSGSNTWTSTAGYQLTCDALHAHPARSNCPTGFAVSLGRIVVLPGASITFTITLRAPSIPGMYNAWLSMAHGDALFSTMTTAALSLAIQYPTMPQPTTTPAPQPTNTPQPAPTNTPQPAPTNTPQPAPTATPQPQPTDTPTPQPTDTPTPEPTPTDTPQPTPTDTPMPTATAAQPTSTVQTTASPVDTSTPSDATTPSAVPTSSTSPLSLWQAM